MSDPRLTALAAALPASVPFVGPETQERMRARPFRARLGANESGFGPSQAAVDAVAQAATQMWKYGDPEGYDLREALASHHGIDRHNVVLGEGIDGLLGTLVRLFTAPGDAVVTSAGAYPTFAYHVAGFGGTLHPVPFAGDHEDLDALVAEARRTGAKLVYLSNPDNPMGSWHTADRVRAALDTLPDTTLLVLDEAYSDFAPAGTLPDIDPQDTRLIRMRTFSKAHGLAGLRIGYAIGQKDLIQAFDKVRNHFGVGRMSQVAALASLADPAHLRRTIGRVEAARAEIGRIAAENGLVALRSATNFVTIDCGGDGPFARAVLKGLLDRDIFVRMPGTAPLDRCIRISAAPPGELEALAAALPGALDQARNAAGNADAQV